MPSGNYISALLSHALDAAARLPSPPADHYKRYHSHGFDPSKNHCKYREGQSRSDEADALGGSAVAAPSATPAEQYAAVVAAYTNPDGSKKPGWMKAPNGKPTNLTERQWVQVRTPFFKAWFGDWEALSVRNAIEATREIDFGNAVPPDMERLVSLYKTGDEGDFSQVLSWAKAQVRRENVNRDIGEILTSSHSVRDILRHASRYNRGPLKVLVFRHLDEILRNAVLYGSEKQGDRTKFFLAHRMRFEGRPYLARVTVEETKNGQRTYTVEFTDRLKWNETDAVATTQGASSRESATPLRPSDTASILRRLYAVNPHSVSKVVDSNGEPLVVWHGLKIRDAELVLEGGDVRFLPKFRVFDTTKGVERGAFFSSEQGRAEPYSDARITAAFFLDIRNPKETDDALLSKPRGHDGAYRANVGMGKEWVVFSPLQIKSATDNGGGFSPVRPSVLDSAAHRLLLLR